MIPDEIKQSIIDIVHQEIWKTASLTTAAILAGGTFIIFLAKNWLLNWVQNKVSHGFDQKLEAYKAELQEKAAVYQNELQQKFEMFKTVTSQIQDRRTRSNEKEYSACLECWTAIYEAYSSLLYSFRYVHIDQHLNGSSIETIKEFLKDNDFLDGEIQQIISDQDKDKAYKRITNMRNVNTAHKKIKESDHKLLINSIFLSKELYDKCNYFVQLMGGTWSDLYSRFFNHNISTTMRNVKEFDVEGQSKLNEIMEILRTNLHIRTIDGPLEPSPNDVSKPSPAPQPSSPGNTPEPEPTAPK